MILEDAVDFLRQAPPLAFLEPEALRSLARKASLEFYPAGTAVLGPGGAGEGFVLAVRKGLLAAGSDTGCACAPDQEPTWGEGEVAGWSVERAVAREDAVCILLEPAAVADALRPVEGLTDFLEDRLTEPVLELGLEGVAREIPPWAASRRPLAALRAGEAVRPGEPVACGATLREAARLMSATARDALVVLGPEGRTAGVITDRDFRARAVEQGLPPDTPVERVMSSPVISLDAQASCFDALMAMTRHHLRHVVVMAGSKPAGVLSAQDLLLRQAGSPPALAARAVRAASVEELSAIAPLLDKLAMGLLREGARASVLGRIVGGLRETLAARACQLAEEALGPPPAPYALMLLGRAARREGPALCPLWNAVVHQEAPGASGWFERLGSFLAEALELMNIAPAPGAPSAASREWRGTPQEWDARLDRWAQSPPEDPACLDLRPVHGQLHLAEALRVRLAGRMVLSGSPPASRPGAGLAERVADGVRRMAWRTGVPRIATAERALGLHRLDAAGEDLVWAAEYLAAWGWVGEPLRPGPLARAMERMCRAAWKRAGEVSR
ncbi:hypothetical protein NNJEOMEG_00872 [Fundidesulfovibrio magnetotacticus]|uniref:CBS domain-containing protein n=1 Tax=Fundidesulfovibrio magnetotacticus TaxID=2730080 RepID=A0A6V8LK03_9BACT|nr:DUF294 nucleotidyltransferase-like domain-containing protein [Fundidesulfovibrio magnetotacticus]GFK93043.1 hypothetical protein NNJEOMEG_00872 [Fundidesulfovibrio magnetotacticus]